MRRPVLLPLVPLYAAGLALREMRLERGWENVRRLRWPVISIGNLSTGGSGKTPLTIALARMLAGRGFGVDVLSRGYGRRSRETALVRLDGSIQEFGDEPLLIAREAGVPVYVALERFDAGQLAEADAGRSGEGPRVHILDDGFQHRQLARDVDVLLVNRDDWQDHLLPTGNLRERLDAAKRASVVAIPAEDRGFEQVLREWGWTGPVWRVRRRIDVPQISGAAAASCGIARPEQFFAGLEGAGVRLVFKKAFADHHRYAARDIQNLVANARAAGATALITTQKDEVRMGNLTEHFPAEFPLRIARLEVAIDDEDGVMAWIEERLAYLQTRSRTTTS
jgi:tetraacyldisaccharide 4'-kinase